MRVFLVFLAAVAGCQAHVTVDQPKPLEVNVNLSGHVDIVIHDARQDLEQITGEKAHQVVRPEDIGLPASPTAPGKSSRDDAAAAEGQFARLDDSSANRFVPILFIRANGASTSARPERRPNFYEVASADDLKKSMAARSAQIRSLWDGGLVGETHGGMLEAKGTLDADQKTLVAAENADRTALYAAEAQQKKSTVDDVALSYYLARLGYAKPNSWYEKYNQSTKKWEWKQWSPAGT